VAYCNRFPRVIGRRVNTRQSPNLEQTTHHVPIPQFPRPFPTSSIGTRNIGPQSDAAQQKRALRKPIFLRDLLYLQGAGVIMAHGEAGCGQATDVHHHAVGSPYARCTMLGLYRKHTPYITHHPLQGHGIVMGHVVLAQRHKSLL